MALIWKILKQHNRPNVSADKKNISYELIRRCSFWAIDARPPPPQPPPKREWVQRKSGAIFRHLGFYRTLFSLIR